jgi:hypothetical protein
MIHYWTEVETYINKLKFVEVIQGTFVMTAVVMNSAATPVAA